MNLFSRLAALAALTSALLVPGLASAQSFHAGRGFDRDRDRAVYVAPMQARGFDRDHDRDYGRRFEPVRVERGHERGGFPVWGRR